MKALILSDEINDLHWTMLKSVLLILSLLPLSYFFLNLRNSTNDCSQIVIGFFAISLFSASTLVSFSSALQATVMQLSKQDYTALDQKVFQVYRYVPMAFLMVILSYLAFQF